LLLPQRVKSNSDQGFALLSFGEKPCPLSLSHGFSPYSHRQAGHEKKGTGYFFSKKEKVSTHGQNNRKSSLSPFSPRQSRAVSMSERSELRSRREERMENGVKNLKGSEAISQNLLVAF